MTNVIRSRFQAHPYHLVAPSPWPLLTSISLFGLTSSTVCLMHSYNEGIVLVMVSLINVCCSSAFWFRDIIREATLEGHHTLAVQRGITLGVGLFIVSEALFFLAIFWSYFHTSLSPVAEMGTTWPPRGIESINPFELPLLNTIILLASGFTVTYGHHSIIGGNRNGTIDGIALTIVLALVFTALQGVEYEASSFTISDSTYGSAFYFATGFHGLHVIIGTIFIAVGLWRSYSYHLTDNHHIGLESSILYWHFVDIVWLFLFFSIYYWGS